MSGEAPEEGEYYYKISDTFEHGVRAPKPGPRYPGEMPREVACMLYGEGLVDLLDQWAKEDAENPRPRIPYRIYRSHNSTERGREVGHFGKRSESFAQIFRSRR